jgi:hypothetical protein
MPTCKLCSNKFPVSAEVAGKKRNLQRRKYCLTCSPFGSGNTKKLECTEEVDPDLKRVRDHEKYRRWQQKARKERKEKLVQAKGGKCLLCGYNRCLRALEFHHVDEEQKQDKSFAISSNGMLAAWKTLLGEVKKCVLVCSNCHREIHDGMHPELVRDGS